MAETRTREELTTGRRVVDRRAGMAAIALLITGVIISLMVEQYLTAQQQAAAFTRSRLWWEIVLNLQLLSAAMMWFSYNDRIGEASGDARGWLIFRQWLGVTSVLMPSFIALIGIFHNWLEVKPRGDIVVGFAAMTLMVWGSAVALRRIVESRAGNFVPKWSAAYHLMYFAPILSLLLLGAFCLAMGDVYWIVAAPFLLYLQGAMPFVLRVFGMHPRAGSTPETG